MTTSDSARAGTGEHGLVVERLFEAPRELVWRAWTQPEHFMRWYGPKGFTLPTCEIDFRVGGRHLFGMRSPAGQQYWSTGTYLEIVPLERIRYKDAPADEYGNALGAKDLGMPDGASVETVVTVIFEALGIRQTRVTLQQVGWADDAMAAGASAGWNEAFDKLARVEAIAPFISGESCTGQAESTMTWNAGDQIALRWTGHRSWLEEKNELEAGRRRVIPGLLQGWPHYVVEDRPDLLVLWMPAGSVTQLVDLADRSKPSVPSVWRRDRLLLMFPGKPYAVTLDWTPDPSREFVEKPQRLYVEHDPARYFEQKSRPFEGRSAHTFLGWTVDLQAPFARTAVGVDSTNGALDVLVAPDMTWSWKNDDVMPLLVDLGIYRAEDVTTFEEAGRDAIALLEARRFPFDGSYLDWRAPEAWGVPALPAGWELAPDPNLNRITGALVPSEPSPSS